MCILCDLIFDRFDFGDKYSDERDWQNNALALATHAYVTIYGCKGKNGNIFLVGDDENATFYYPKYCPECGRRLYDNDKEREEMLEGAKDYYWGGWDTAEWKK